MKFEWDESKNQTNLRKHGIDFADVVEVFEHPMLVLEDDREDYYEVRWTGIGLMKYHVVVVVYTERRGDTIRIISARKATKREVKCYEEIL